MRLEDAVVVVTGGGSGIGAAMCRRFARGAPRAITVVDLDADGATAVAEEIRRSHPEVSVHAATVDVSDESQVVDLIGEVNARDGLIDLFCGNAGIGVATGIETPDDVWRRVIDVNVMAHVYATRALIPAWLERGSGHFVLTASAAGLLTNLGDAPYSVTKHGAVALAEWLSITYGDRGITVSCLCPQGVRTPLLFPEMRGAARSNGGDSGTGSHASGDGPPLALEAVKLQRLLEPEDVADMVVAAVEDGRFLILPHEEVAAYEQARAGDRERWLSSMRRLQAKITGVEPAARRTLEVYEQHAADWQDRRRPTRGDAHEFAESLQPSERPVVDLGCGPGWHLPELPAGTIAMDATAAMLRLSAVSVPGAPRVRGDLAALPFARHSVGAAWANKSYVHVDRRALPMAWWDLHRSLRVGAPAFLGLFEGDADHTVLDDDDFPGRSFSLWPESLLAHVLEGAGFDVELLVHPPAGEHRLGVWVRSRRTLADTVGPGMRLLLVGLNPSLRAADAGVGFVTPGNRAWPALSAAGLATVDRDPLDLLTHHRIGMTDLVKRASPGAAEVRPEEYRHGLERLEALCTWLQPAAVCIVGLAGWRAAADRHAVAGVQERRLGGRPVYVMPNPSGLNTHVTVEDLAVHFRAAAALADRSAALADPGDTN